jgi:hypothetical protein
VFLECDNGVNVKVCEGDRILYWRGYWESENHNPREGVVQEICSTREFIKIKYAWISVKDIVLHEVLPSENREVDSYFISLVGLCGLIVILICLFIT